MTKKLLIVIDCQNDFITGALRNEEAIRKLPDVVKLIKEHEGTVIATRDTHFTKDQIKAWPMEPGVAYEDSLEGKLLPVPHCIKGTPGWQIADIVLEALEEKNTNGMKKYHVIDKLTFGYKDWEKELKFYDFDEIEICGFCTDICVVSNALLLRAIYPNKKITVNGNYCAGVTVDTHKAALTTMKMCQIDVINED